jgi:hypothetical protein
VHLEDAGTRAKFVLHDRDASVTEAFDAVFRTARTRVIRPGTPNVGVCLLVQTPARQAQFGDYCLRFFQHDAVRLEQGVDIADLVPDDCGFGAQAPSTLVARPGEVRRSYSGPGCGKRHRR